MVMGYTLAQTRMRTKTIITTIRLSETDDAALREVSEELGLDMSNTIRLLVHDKRRELRRRRAAALQRPATGS